MLTSVVGSSKKYHGPELQETSSPNRSADNNGGNLNEPELDKLNPGK
jgi:hypothetical protein